MCVTLVIYQESPVRIIKPHMSTLTSNLERVVLSQFRIKVISLQITDYTRLRKQSLIISVGPVLGYMVLNSHSKIWWIKRLKLTTDRN